MKPQLPTSTAPTLEQWREAAEHNAAAMHRAEARYHAERADWLDLSAENRALRERVAQLESLLDGATPLAFPKPTDTERASA